jgi:hypothetical protein
VLQLKFTACALVCVGARNQLGQQLANEFRRNYGDVQTTRPTVMFHALTPVIFLAPGLLMVFVITFLKYMARQGEMLERKKF